MKNMSLKKTRKERRSIGENAIYTFKMRNISRFFFMLAVRSINARKPAAGRAGREAPTPPAVTPVVGGRFTRALSQRLRAKVRKTLTSYSVGQREEHPTGSCSVLTRRTRRTSTNTGTQTTLQSLVLFHLR